MLNIINRLLEEMRIVDIARWIAYLFIGLVVLMPLFLVRAQTITLNSPTVMSIPLNGTFSDPGGSLVDASGNPLPWSSVSITNYIDNTKSGAYQVLYNYPGAIQTVRYVNVLPAAPANTLPVISAQDPLTYVVGEAVKISDNVICTDAEDGYINSPGLVITPPTFDAATPVGDYTVTIECTDSSGGVSTDLIDVKFTNELCGSSNILGTCKSACGAGEEEKTATCGAGEKCCATVVGDTTAPTGFVPCEGTECSFCHLVSMANTIITWLITLLFLIFAIIIAVAGFNLVTSGGNPSAKNDAKSKLVNALTGIIIVLVAWLLVDTLMRAMVGGTGEINGRLWTKVDCYTQSETKIDQVDYVGSYTDPVTGAVVATPAGNSAVAGEGLSANAASSQLSAAGVGVKSGATLEGVKPHVIDNIIALDGATGGNITITEATGGKHASGDFSHENGYKLDLRTSDNPGLVSYIESSYSYSGSWKDGTKTYYDSATCGTYAIENDHVDVVYKTGC